MTFCMCRISETGIRLSFESGFPILFLITGNRKTESDGDFKTSETGIGIPVFFLQNRGFGWSDRDVLSNAVNFQISSIHSSTSICPKLNTKQGLIFDFWQFDKDIEYGVHKVVPIRTQKKKSMRVCMDVVCVCRGPSYPLQIDLRDRFGQISLGQIYFRFQKF